MSNAASAIRRFTWSDVPTLGGLQAGHGLPTTQSAATDALVRWLRQPNLDPERDCFIAFQNGAATGYGFLVVEQPISRGVLILETLPTPEQSATDRELITTAAAHAGTLGLAVLQVDVPESDATRRSSLSAAGMSHVRTHRHLRREGTAQAEGTPPSGATLRLATPEDVPALTGVQNAAFAGTWGYCPNTPEEVRYRIFDLPQPPDDVLLLFVNGELTAYCWTHREDPGGAGVIGMVGVRPDQQGRGLGRVVTAAGINHLIERDATPVDITVDQDNTPAVALYERLGFEAGWRSLWYELTLR